MGFFALVARFGYETIRNRKRKGDSKRKQSRRGKEENR